MTNWQFMSFIFCIIVMWFFSFATLFSIIDKIATKIAEASILIIDYYFKSKEEHYKKMLKDGIDNRFMN